MKGGGRGRGAKTDRSEEEAIKRSILEDMCNPDVLYNGERGRSGELQVGISMLTDLEIDAETGDRQLLAGLCSQFSSELRVTKHELSKLYKENRHLHKRLLAQESHIQALNRLYKDQTTTLKQEVLELRNQLIVGQYSDAEVNTKPTIETEENWPRREDPRFCCRIL